MLTAPLRSAVSGDVPAHSGVSAPCGVGYANICIRNLLDAPSEPVNNVVESGRLATEGLTLDVGNVAPHLATNHTCSEGDSESTAIDQFSSRANQDVLRSL